MAETHYLTDILILLAAAVVAVPLFHRLGLGSVLGYLFAGIVVGPWGLGFIEEVERIRHIAEFGVVFLLFIIGIELKPARLWVMRRTVFGLGTAQLLITGLVLTSIALLCELPDRTALIVGFGLALSSTAFGLHILAERGELESQVGRTAFSILLLQDLAVVPLLMLVSFLAQDTSLARGLETAALDSVLVLAGVILFGRFLLSPLLHQVATSRNSEVFTAAAVLVVLGTAWLMSEAGLSMALGAFLAGLMLADSRYRHQVIADIQPFRGILLGLFFVAVGMSINFGLMLEQGMMILTMVAGLLAIKTIVLWGLCNLARVRGGNGLRVSLLLSQSGEFGFVIFGLAAASGLMEQELFEQLVLIIALTMATTPLMALASERLGRRMVSSTREHHVGAAIVASDRPHVIIAGFGRVGRRVARILRAADLPYIALDHDPDKVYEGRDKGFQVFFGDASRPDVLEAAGAEHASVLVITLDKAEAARRLVRNMRQHYADTPIYTRARDSRHSEELCKAGASNAISETLEASVQLGGAVLRANGLDNGKVTGILNDFRRDYYNAQEMDLFGNEP